MKELGGIGRGYMIVFSGLLLAAVLGAIAMFRVPDAAIQVFAMKILTWWGELFIWTVPIVVGAKELGKIGQKFGDGFKAKHNHTEDK